MSDPISKQVQRALNFSLLAQMQKMIDLSGVGQLQKALDLSGIGHAQKMLDHSGIGRIQRVLDESGVGHLSKLHLWSSTKQFQRLLDQTDVAQISSAIADTASLRFISELTATSPVPSLSSLLLSKDFLALAEVPSSVRSSKIFNWLAANPEQLDRAAQLVETEGSEHQAFGTPSVGHVSPSPANEQAIIDALERNEPIDLWTESARAALARAVKWILFTAKCFIALVTLGQAIEWVGEKVEAAMTPAQVRMVASMIPEQFRWVLTTHRLVVRSGVRIRHSPSTKSAIVGFTTVGDVVDVLDERDGWIQIEMEVKGEEVTGWIYKGFTAPFPRPQDK